MANITERLPQNLPGKFYVTSACINCGLCPEIAPAFFTLHEETGYSFVHQQPSYAEEEALAEEARGNCPTDAIGNDGANVPAEIAG